MPIKTVLIIEDEEDIRSTLAIFLESKGYTVWQAEGVERTVRMLNETVPDLIFLDVMLPGLDGIEILKMIKRYDSSVPVVIMSGYASEEIARRSLKLGAYDYVRKPFDLDRIASLLSSIDIVSVQQADTKPPSG